MTNRAKSMAIGGFLGLALLAGGPDPARGTEKDLNAPATVLQGIGFTQTAQLNFGSLQAPSNVTSADYIVDPAGGINDPSGDGRFISGHQAGAVTLTGTDGESFSLTATPDICGGVTLGTITLLAIDLSPTSGSFSGGSASVDIGGTLRVSQGAEGTGTCSYILEAQYQ